MPQPKFTTVTNPTPKSIVDSALTPKAELHLLIGGPYVEKNGEEHRYGHTALRVKSGGIDLTYDFGRYGKVTGLFRDSGEGILRVWSDFSQYINSENSLKRVTTCFAYMVFDSQARAVVADFTRLIKAGKDRIDVYKQGGPLQIFQLNAPYTALWNNCTTRSVDGMKPGIPRIDYGSEGFIKPEKVMTRAERAAMTSIGGGVPNRIFLPANLQDFLTVKPAIKANRVEKFGHSL
jgi:hypothetical protein